MTWKRLKGKEENEDLRRNYIEKIIWGAKGTAAEQEREI